MKRFLFFFLTLLPLAAAAAPAEKNVPKGELSAIISEFRRCDGVEVVRLGRMGTAAIRGIVRMAAKEDPDARQALDVMRGVRRITVLQYEDCAPEVRERLVRRLDRALDGCELLMEAKDGDTAMRMFGVVDEASGEMRDFVIHAPSECALICVFGSLKMDSVGKIINAK
ncbi:MAG: DUF4252 domain-containing protein [Bacteroidales bacterium]|nr:DUF4252 domain-containing protein [Bacteroidales bacterium]